MNLRAVMPIRLYARVEDVRWCFSLTTNIMHVLGFTVQDPAKHTHTHARTHDASWPDRRSGLWCIDLKDNLGISSRLWPVGSPGTHARAHKTHKMTHTERMKLCTAVIYLSPVIRLILIYYSFPKTRQQPENRQLELHTDLWCPARLWWLKAALTTFSSLSPSLAWLLSYSFFFSFPTMTSPDVHMDSRRTSNATVHYGNPFLSERGWS